MSLSSRLSLMVSGGGGGDHQAEQPAAPETVFYRWRTVSKSQQVGSGGTAASNLRQMYACRDSQVQTDGGWDLGLKKANSGFRVKIRRPQRTSKRTPSNPAEAGKWGTGRIVGKAWRPETAAHRGKRVPNLPPGPKEPEVVPSVRRTVIKRDSLIEQANRLDSGFRRRNFIKRHVASRASFSFSSGGSRRTSLEQQEQGHSATLPSVATSAASLAAAAISTAAPDQGLPIGSASRGGGPAIGPVSRGLSIDSGVCEPRKPFLVKTTSLSSFSSSRETVAGSSAGGPLRSSQQGSSSGGSGLLYRSGSIVDQLDDYYFSSSSRNHIKRQALQQLLARKPWPGRPAATSSSSGTSSREAATADIEDLKKGNHQQVIVSRRRGLLGSLEDLNVGSVTVVCPQGPAEDTGAPEKVAAGAIATKTTATALSKRAQMRRSKSDIEMTVRDKIGLLKLSRMMAASAEEQAAVRERKRLRKMWQDTYSAMCNRAAVLNHTIQQVDDTELTVKPVSTSFSQDAAAAAATVAPKKLAGPAASGGGLGGPQISQQMVRQPYQGSGKIPLIENHLHYKVKTASSSSSSTLSLSARRRRASHRNSSFIGLDQKFYSITFSQDSQESQEESLESSPIQSPRRASLQLPRYPVAAATLSKEAGTRLSQIQGLEGGEEDNNRTVVASGPESSPRKMPVSHKSAAGVAAASAVAAFASHSHLQISSRHPTGQVDRRSSGSFSIGNKHVLVDRGTQVVFAVEDPYLSDYRCCSRSESPEARPVERAIEARTGSEDGLGSMVRCLHFSSTYIANGE